MVAWLRRRGPGGDDRRTRWPFGPRRRSGGEPDAVARWCEARLHGCSMRADGVQILGPDRALDADVAPAQGLTLALCGSCRRRMRGNQVLLQAVVETRERVTRPS